jgi:hypothetical protein
VGRHSPISAASITVSSKPAAPVVVVVSNASLSQRATTSAACRHNGAESASQLDSGRVSRIVPSLSS